MYTTIETRLTLYTSQELLIDSMMSDWSQYYHQAWSMYNRKQLNEKQIYQQLIKNPITSHQVNSIINKVKTEHSKIKQLTIQQAKLQNDKINAIKNFIIQHNKELNSLENNINIIKSNKPINYSKLNSYVNKHKKLDFTIKRKEQKLNRLTALLTIKQNRIQSNNFKLCFGSSNLFKQQIGFGNKKHRNFKSQIVYQDKESWKKAWDLARINQIYSVGDKKQKQGNSEIQYYHNTKKLKIRLTDKLAEQRMKEYCSHNNIAYSEFLSKIKYSPLRMQCRFITIENIEFNHRYIYIFNLALTNKLPISAKIIKKLSPSGEIGFYLQLSMEELNNLPQYKIDKKINKVVVSNNKDLNINNSLPNILTRRNILGIDLNASGLAYTIVKIDGNRLVDKRSNKTLNGFISWNLNKTNSNQNKLIISETLEKIISICKTNNIQEIAIENLDFNQIKNNMNSGFKTKFNKKYNKMLSQFISSQFKEILIRKCFRNNIIVKLVNPSFSSIGGFTKYGIINKTQADVSASLWLARQGLYGIPYKVESNVITVKKHEELVSFPYLVNPKQSKKELNKIKWKDISLAIGKDRSLWFNKTINYINSLSGVVQTDYVEKEFNLFQYT